MENKKIYAIFGGEYSDWNVYGYFTTLNEAEKYCALKNSDGNRYGDYYVVGISPINADVSNVKMKYYHEVMFDFNKGMRNEPTRYEYYTGKDKESKIIYNVFKDDSGWISFSFSCESREKAEKIAQDKYAKFLNYYADLGAYDVAAELIGAKRV